MKLPHAVLHGGNPGFGQPVALRLVAAQEVVVRQARHVGLHDEPFFLRVGGAVVAVIGQYVLKFHFLTGDTRRGRIAVALVHEAAHRLAIREGRAVEVRIRFVADGIEIGSAAVLVARHRAAVYGIVGVAQHSIQKARVADARERHVAIGIHGFDHFVGDAQRPDIVVDRRTQL